MHADADHAVRRLVKKLALVTVVIEFVANLYALPLAVELIGTPVIILFSIMQTNIVPLDDVTRRFVDRVLTIVGLVYLAHVVVRLATDDSLFTRVRAEEFLVGPVLTIALIPFLYAVAWRSRRELEQLRAQFNSPA